MLSAVCRPRYFGVTLGICRRTSNKQLNSSEPSFPRVLQPDLYRLSVSEETLIFTFHTLENAAATNVSF